MSNQADVNIEWWEADESDLHLKALAVLRGIYTRQSYIETRNRHHIRMYADTESVQPWRTGVTSMSFRPSKLAYNVVKNCSDALAAQLSKSRPLPMFLTTRGSYAQQKRAKQMNQFVEGAFYESRFWSTRQDVLLDTTVQGTGFYHPYRDGERIHVERVMPGEIWVDDWDGVYGEPQSIFRIKWMSRSKLIKLFPNKRKQLETAEVSAGLWRQSTSSTIWSDMICVVEAHHLPSSSKMNGTEVETTGDGRHTIFCSSCTLVDEEWKYDFFPYIPVRRSRMPEGYWGVGVAQELSGIQYEINVTASKLQRAHHIMGGSYWLLPRSAKIPTSHIDNQIGTIIQYDGPQPPDSKSPTPINPQTYSYLESLVAKAYEMTGINQLTAQAEAPKVESGKARQMTLDVQSERFAMFSRNDEEACLEVARQIIRLGWEIYEENPKFAVRLRKKTGIELAKWGDFALPESDYFLQCWPTNMLSRTPQARIDQVQSLINSQLLTPDEGKRLLDFPDIEATIDLQNSSYTLANDAIDRIIEDGVIVGPEGAMNLQQAKQIAVTRLLRAKIDGESGETLSLIADYIQQVDDLLARAGGGGDGAGGPPDAAPNDQILGGQGAQAPQGPPGMPNPAELPPEMAAPDPMAGAPPGPPPGPPGVPV